MSDSQPTGGDGRGREPRSWLARRRLGPALEAEAGTLGQSSWRGDASPAQAGAWRLMARRIALTVAALTLIAFLVRELLTVRRFLPVVTLFASSYRPPYPPLPLVDEDRRLLETLATSGRFFFQQPPVIITDVSAQASTASADEMTAILTSAVREVRPGGPADEAVVVHLSVVGTVDEAGRPCIVPQNPPMNQGSGGDAGQLDVDRLLQALRAALPEQARLVVVLDATRSTDGWPLGTDGGGFAAGVEAMLAASPLKKTWVFLPSAIGQEARASAAAGCSGWMWAFVNGMAGAADRGPHGDRDGQVEVRELAAYLAVGVDQFARETVGDRQVPILLTSADEHASDVALTWAAGDAARPRSSTATERADDSWLARHWRAAERLRDRSIRERPLLWSTYLSLLMRAEMLREAGSAYRAEQADVERRVERIEADLELPLIASVNLLPGMRLAGRPEAPAEEMGKWVAEVAAFVVPPDERPAPTKPPVIPDGVEPWLAHTTAAWHWLIERCAGDAPLTREMVVRWLACVEPRPEGASLVPTQIHILQMLVRWADPEEWRRHPGVFRDLIRLVDVSRVAAYGPDVRLDSALLAEPAITQSTAAMLRGIDLAFVGGDQALAEAAALVTGCREDYEQLIDLSRRYRLILDLSDAMRAELPYLATWWVEEQRYAARVPNDPEIASLRLDPRVWAAALGAVEQLDAVEAALVGRGRAVTRDLLDEAERIRAGASQALSVIRSAYEARCSDLATHAPDSPRTHGAIRRVLTVPLVQGDVRMRLLRRAEELDRRHVDRARWEQAEAPADLPAPDQRAATAGWIVWRDLFVNPVLPVLGSDAAGAPALPVNPADVAAAIGRQAAAARAAASGLPAAIAALDRQREALDIGAPDAEAEAISLLARASAAARRLAPLAGQWPQAVTVATPTQRYLAAAWHRRLIGHANRMLNEFWASLDDREPPYCLDKAGVILDVAADIVRTNGVVFGDVQRSQVAARIASLGVQFAELVVSPPRLLLPAGRGVAPPRTAMRAQSRAGVPGGVAAAWLSESAESPPLAVLRGGTAQPGVTVSRLGLPVGTPAVDVSWETDPGAVDFARLARSSVIDLTCLFRGHRLVVGMPVAAAEPPRITTWEAPRLPPPQVTVRGETSKPQSVAIVFDCSGSMGQRGSDGSTRLDAGRNAVAQIVEQLSTSGRWQVSLWLYGHRTRWSRDAQGRFTAGLTPLGEAAKAAAARDGQPFALVPGDDVENVVSMRELTVGTAAQIADALAPLEPGGETPLFLAISEAVAVDFSGVRANAPGHVLVVTDGANDQTGGRYVTAGSLEDQLARLNGRRTEPLRIDVIGFALGGDPGERVSRMDEVRNLASSSGGRFSEAANTGSLRKALRESLRLLQWRVAGPGAAPGPQPLGTSLQLPAPPPGADAPYDAILEAGATRPHRGFRVHDGDAIELHASVGGRALEFRRYDGGTEQGIRDACSPVLDPSEPGRRLFIAAHMARRSGDDVHFPVSIQNADASEFSQRPTEQWVEIRPVDAAGNVGDPFTFYDPTYQPGRTVPVLDLVATQWPADASHAEIRGWFRFDTTLPDLSIAVRDLRPGAEKEMDVPGMPGASLAVSATAPDATGSMTVTVRESYVVGPALPVPHLRVIVTGDVRRATHVVEAGTGRVRHDFLVDVGPDGSLDDLRVLVTDQQRIMAGACAVTADGRPPLRVVVPSR